MDLMKPLDANVMKARPGPLEPSTAHKPSANQKSAANNQHSQSQSCIYVRNAIDQ